MNNLPDKNLVVSIGKCSLCGKHIKYGASYMGKIYGTDCFNKVAKDFIETRDKLNSINEINKLAEKYRVESL